MTTGETMKPLTKLAFILAALPLVFGCGEVVNRALDGSIYPSPTSVMGPPSMSAKQLAGFYFETVMLPRLARGEVPCYRATVPLEELTDAFIAEGAAEGVRGDVAFVQSMLETGNFCWPGGQVRPSDNNFAGLGATDGGGGRNVARFPTARIGVRAQMQHLRAYADDGAHCGPPCYDSRFELVQPHGKAPYWDQFGNGIWASSTNDYAGRILRRFAEALAYRDTHP